MARRRGIWKRLGAVMPQRADVLTLSVAPPWDTAVGRSEVYGRGPSDDVGSRLDISEWPMDLVEAAELGDADGVDQSGFTADEWAGLEALAEENERENGKAPAKSGGFPWLLVGLGAAGLFLLSRRGK